MKLLKLTLSNFKGIKSFTLDTQGGNSSVWGDNATGKTTLFDAFLWLLFDKDSSNRKDFDIKTLDENGQVKHGLEHTVEAILDLEPDRLVLRKVYSEVWTKKRGSIEPAFSGHQVDHFIDGVPVKKGEFTAKIAEIINEDVFKLLTSPLYFSTQMHWQDRRKVLLDICGDVSIKDVVAANSDLIGLEEILGNRTLDAHRKVIAARRAEINRELEKIPVRIDEITHGLPSIEGIKPESLTQDMAKLRGEIREKQQEVATIQSGGQVAEKTKALRMVESEILDLKNRYQAKLDEKVSVKRDELNQTRQEIGSRQVTVGSLTRKISDAQDRIEQHTARMNTLRQQWQQVNNQQFNFEQEDCCPTCGQLLPRAQIEAAREKAQLQFNGQKAERLEAINSEGRKLKEQNSALEAQVAQWRDELEAVATEIKGLEANQKDLQEYIQAVQSGSQPFTEFEEYVQLTLRKSEIESEIRSLEAGSLEAVAAVHTVIHDLQESLRELERAEARLQQREQSMKRIEELSREQRKLSMEYEQLEKELFLTEEFIRTKVQLLEEKINSRFKMARFKLFDQQINGGLAECCEMQYQGVPFGSLNNAARINVGLDIINTLAEHYGVTAPIFVDNAEAVTEFIETRGQAIRLVVSEKDKKLRVEPDAKDLFAYGKEAV